MDPYVYPGTNVLKNLRDIRDPEALSTAEAIATTRRVSELQLKPLPGRFDILHLQSIHRHIFQDIYPWAGKFRQVNIARSGQFYFAFHEQIVSVLTKPSTSSLKSNTLSTLIPNSSPIAPPTTLANSTPFTLSAMVTAAPNANSFVNWASTPATS